MNNLNYNFPGNNKKEYCICLNQLTNEKFYPCKLLNNNVLSDFQYENIFNGTVQDQNKMINILNQNTKNLPWHRMIL